MFNLDTKLGRNIFIKKASQTIKTRLHMGNTQYKKAFQTRKRYTIGSITAIINYPCGTLST